MAAGIAPRSIVIDDTDPSIQYSDVGWFTADVSKLNALGNYGQVYNSTSHGTTTTGSTFTFPFNGTSITVMGTIDISTDAATNATDPAWNCYVDEIPIKNPNPTFQYPENNWPLCQLDQVASGSHELKVQVTTKGTAFYLDKLVYTPLPSVSEPQAVVQYMNTDPSVSFGSGWRIWGAQNVTQTKGAQVALNFHGTSASLYGYVPTELSHNASSATYTIDGGPVVPFALKGLGASSATAYNTLFFTTATLTSAVHNLVVTHQGDGSVTPLVVGSFLVTNTSTPSPSSSSPDPSVSPDLSNTPISKSKSTPVGGIVGGVVGCLAVLALVAGLVFFCRRRRRRTEEQVRRTSANPFTDMAAASTAPVLVSGAAGGPYSYSAVSSQGYASPRVDTPGLSMGTGSSMTPATAGHSYSTPPPQTDMGSSFGVPHVHGPSSSYSGSHNPSAGGSHNASTSYSGSTNDLVGGRVQDSAPVAPPRSDTGRSVGKYEREMMATAAYTNLTPLRANHGGPVVVQRHQDSGVRLKTHAEPEFMELPPGYSAD
ncbi:hypothetical protein FB45DRAFT_919096 [Roridomyces roridus]|uniref:Transmembrane protein n=1 Tax=Roridomyces roridus TaxID=1738132 RepID=A0AAD7BRQ9_9AGAR|nr:hypothetical protein FB45DRAFT_919096 [Roridomyces roridus]